LKTRNQLLQVDNSYTITSFLEKRGRTASFIPKLKQTYTTEKTLRYAEHLPLKGLSFTLWFYDFCIKNLSAEFCLSTATGCIISTIHTVTINFGKLVGLMQLNKWLAKSSQSPHQKESPNCKDKLH